MSQSRRQNKRAEPIRLYDSSLLYADSSSSITLPSLSPAPPMSPPAFSPPRPERDEHGCDERGARRGRNYAANNTVLANKHHASAANHHNFSATSPPSTTTSTATLAPPLASLSSSPSVSSSTSTTLGVMPCRFTNLSWRSAVQHSWMALHRPAQAKHNVKPIHTPRRKKQQLSSNTTQANSDDTTASVNQHDKNTQEEKEASHPTYPFLPPLSTAAATSTSTALSSSSTSSSSSCSTSFSIGTRTESMPAKSPSSVITTSPSPPPLPALMSQTQHDFESSRSLAPSYSLRFISPPPSSTASASPSIFSSSGLMGPVVIQQPRPVEPAITVRFTLPHTTPHNSIKQTPSYLEGVIENTVEQLEQEEEERRQAMQVLEEEKRQSAALEQVEADRRRAEEEELCREVERINLARALEELDDLDVASAMILSLLPPTASAPSSLCSEQSLTLLRLWRPFTSSRLVAFGMDLNRAIRFCRRFKSEKVEIAMQVVEPPHSRVQITGIKSEYKTFDNSMLSLLYSFYQPFDSDSTLDIFTRLVTSSSPPSTPSFSSTHPFTLTGAIHHAQAVEIVERLADKGIEAKVQDMDLDDEKEERDDADKSHTTLFSLHLRLSTHHPSITLLHTIRAHLPAYPHIDYLVIHAQFATPSPSPSPSPPSRNSSEAELSLSPSPEYTTPESRTPLSMSVSPAPRSMLTIPIPSDHLRGVASPVPQHFATPRSSSPDMGASGEVDVSDMGMAGDESDKKARELERLKAWADQIGVQIYFDTSEMEKKIRQQLQDEQEAEYMRQFELDEANRARQQQEQIAADRALAEALDQRESGLLHMTNNKNWDKLHAIREQNKKKGIYSDHKHVSAFESTALPPSSSSSSSSSLPTSSSSSSSSGVTGSPSKPALTYKVPELQRIKSETLPTPTKGETMKKHELYDENHREMRRFLHAATSGVQVQSSDEELEEWGEIQEHRYKDKHNVLTSPSVPHSQLWNLAHMPSMLDDLKKGSLLPGHNEPRQLKVDGLHVTVEDEKSDDEIRTHKVAALRSHDHEYDKLTGLHIAVLGELSLRERLERAEKRINEAEMDDMYKRFLTAKSDKDLKKEQEKDAKKRRKSTKFKSSASTSNLNNLSAIAEASKSGDFDDAISRIDESTIDGPLSPRSPLPDEATSPRSTKSPRRRRSSRSLKSPSHSKSHSMFDIPSPIRADSNDLGSPTLARSGSKPQLKKQSSRRSSFLSTVGKEREFDQTVYWLDISLSASQLDNPQLVGKPDPYVEVYRCRQYIWELISSTEMACKTLNPHYNPLLINLDSLCNMQLERKIMFRVWTANRMQGRTLIGELIISVTKLQSNIGAKFPILNPDKVGKVNGYKQSGFVRFHYAELCVNTTKSYQAFPSPNVIVPTNPSFEHLTHCSVRIVIHFSDMPDIGLIFKDKPDCHMEIFSLQQDGNWNTTPVFRTEPIFQSNRPKFPSFTLSLHTLCYGDVNRSIRIRARHHDTTLGWLETTVRDMVMKQDKKMYFQPANSNNNNNTSTASSSSVPPTPTSKHAAPTPSNKQPPLTPSSSSKSLNNTCGYMTVDSIKIFSHLADLPLLMNAAGIQRRPIPGISDLPLPQLLQGEYDAEKEANEKKQAEQKSQSSHTVPSLDPAENPEPAATNPESDLTTSLEQAAPPSSIVIPRNVYRGMHHVREVNKNKFFQSFAPVEKDLLEARQIAFLMGGHSRLGAGGSVYELMHSPIFDRHLIPYLWTWM